MSEIAIIRSGVVDSVIVADMQFATATFAASDVDLVDVTDTAPMPGIGWAYSSGVFTAPIQPEPEPPSPVSYGRIITRLAFLNRFTDAEAVAIDLASIGATVQAATLRRANAKINAAEEIQLDLPETRAGVLALEAAGLIAAGRAAQILDSPVQSHEVPARYRATYGLPEVPA